ncbi:amidase signature domain-containing protein [Leptodontidium sp. MPI-SDFR-AT-0119]|nr:amidase signature domain-containing protein [Leptodontidium sp. MPI-SDFR-AT-0119]
MAGTTDWKALVSAKRADRASRIPKDWTLPESITSKVSSKSPVSAFDLLAETSVLTLREHELTEKYDATALLEKMASKELTSLEVTTAFCKRAALAQQLTNCLTEIFFDKALERAQECDDYLNKNGKTMGTFHGLPMSLKDMLMVKGEAATLGFVSYLKKPVAQHDSYIVQIMLEAGAVLYCKTNVPQTLFVCESHNNVFGTTMNPYKLSLTSAGSSSGEGALVGFRGSILGVGSDIGGSVRAPALCCGTFGFKPSVDRLPWGGQQALIRQGWPGVLPTLGPHATSAQDLTLFTKTILTAKPWKRDSTAHAIPWRDVPKKQHLTIGVWGGDADFPITPPVARILKEATAKLESKGHTVKHIKCPSLSTALKFASPGYKFDTSNKVFEFLSEGEEEPVPELHTAAPPDDGAPVDLEAIWNFNANKENYREEWAKVWRENDIDVLVCPGSRQVAPPHGKFGVPYYTMIWNYLDFPASVVPFSKVDKSVDSVDMKDYDVNAVEGAPGSVQVVGWRFQDEETLNATEVIAESLKM